MARPRPRRLVQRPNQGHDDHRSASNYLPERREMWSYSKVAAFRLWYRFNRIACGKHLGRSREVGSRVSCLLTVGHGAAVSFDKGGTSFTRGKVAGLMSADSVA